VDHALAGKIVSDAAQDGPARWSTTERWVFAVFVAGVLASLFFSVHPWYDRTNDGSTYLITARSIAADEGYTYLGEVFRMRPPGFSALLALLVAEDGSVSFLALNLLVSLFGVAGIVLLYLYQRANVGWLLALLTSLAVWLNPGYQRLCNQVMSDVPGLALVLACLLVERWTSRDSSWHREIVLGLAIGAGAYVRSITILLVSAILVARVLHQWRHSGGKPCWPSFALRRLALFAVVGWLVVLPWNVVRQRSAPPPPADQTLNYSISTAMWHTDPGDPRSPRVTPGQLLQRAPTHLREAVLVLGSRMQQRIPGSPLPDVRTALGRSAVALLMLACVLFALVRRRAPAECFTIGVLLVVAIYFVFTDRLVLPVFVFALVATVEVSRDLVRKIAGMTAATVVPAAALLLLIAIDFKPRHDWDAIETRHREFAEMASAIEQTLEPDARLAAGQGFHHSVYLNRPVYGLLHAAIRARDFAAAERIIDKYDLNTVVLSPLVYSDLSFADHMKKHYGPGTPADSAQVWRVRP
jgi:hypothetical protein